MNDLLTAIGLVLVFEGAIYALFPRGMKRMIVAVLAEPEDRLRVGGAVIAGIGVAIVWWLRS
ncbi:hypothetical protein GCM10011505_18800 [Tistrella bauzanensis]|uniref:DUF2065 domain-containing protein n=1 Tax=Tistrella bauzanensis TaxID=657419 RepID=A0ABQ1IFQ6_9PROT|nr:DUF2065 domain-containing protein [Tistrella bauzanensis]GGB37541.1 hypothetical protein GCM10011505_18800 [Tistrella bauzanensis]